VATTYAERLAPAAADEEAKQAIRDRLVTPMPDDRLMGWVMPIVVTLIAAAMRLNRLSLPHSQVFDEVYYRKDSHDLYRYAIEKNADYHGPGWVVHPPLGKWMIGWGQRVFDWKNEEIYTKTLTGGHAAFSWRFPSALIGIATVLIVCRLGRRLFRSTMLGCLAGLLMSLDGLHFVQSRAIMLDIAILFWTVVAAACMLADRDMLRRRLADRITASAPYPGPRTGIRWWRIAAGISVGLACGVKWSGVYLIPVFVLLSLGWEIGARRVAGIPSPVRAALWRSTLPILGALVILPVIAYLSTWAGWFLTMDGWRRDCSLAHPGGPWSGMKHPEMCGPIKGLWQYHAETLKFHNGLSSPHKYQSHTWGWLLLARPVSYFYTSPKTGYSRAVLAIGTPAIWWASIFALGATFWKWISARDWRAAYILAGFAATYLPWFWSDMNRRTMFLFYALPALPFMCLALAYVAGLVIGPRTASTERRFWGACAVGAYVAVVLWNFYFMYPVLAGKIIPYSSWQLRMWFSSWV
jgi:dolichyl-phosphate-mannose-protein mannosyltransferase